MFGPDFHAVNTWTLTVDDVGIKMFPSETRSHRKMSTVKRIRQNTCTDLQSTRAISASESNRSPQGLNYVIQKSKKNCVQLSVSLVAVGIVVVHG